MTTAPTEERILTRVAKLLERAYHPGTGAEESAACEAMANQLMAKYEIDQAMLDASRTPQERRKPVERTIRLYGDGQYYWGSKFQTMISVIAETYGVRALIRYGKNEVALVGFATDVDWVELLWTHTFNAFVTKLSPRWEVERSFDDNVRAYKEAGFKWSEIWTNGQRALGEMPCRNVPNDGGYLIRAYKRSCKAAGVTPDIKTQRLTAYRESFAEAFKTRIIIRLLALRDDNAKAAVGSELALFDAMARVDEAFYLLHPEMRPMTPEELAAREKMLKEEAEKIAIEDARFLDSLTPAKRKAELDRREREQRRDAQANERWWSKYEKSHREDTNGVSQGRAAADTVRLARAEGVHDDSRYGKQLGS